MKRKLSELICENNDESTTSSQANDDEKRTSTQTIRPRKLVHVFPEVSNDDEVVDEKTLDEEKIQKCENADDTDDTDDGDDYDEKHDRRIEKKEKAAKKSEYSKRIQVLIDSRSRILDYISYLTSNPGTVREMLHVYWPGQTTIRILKYGTPNKHNSNQCNKILSKMVHDNPKIPYVTIKKTLVLMREAVTKWLPLYHIIAKIKRLHGKIQHHNRERWSELVEFGKCI
jgi:hypothetical protein